MRASWGCVIGAFTWTAGGSATSTASMLKILLLVLPSAKPAMLGGGCHPIPTMAATPTTKNILLRPHRHLLFKTKRRNAHKRERYSNSIVVVTD